MAIKVFIADDHTVVREGLQLLLETHPDIKVVGSAADGKETVYLVQHLHPDVVIMDIAMPRMNGIDATINLRQLCPTTQIVILSMYSTSEHIFRALKAGALSFILKESAAEEIVNAVRTVYKGQRYLCKKIEETMVLGYLSTQISRTKSPIECLSPREREILQLVVEGRSSAEIGIILNLSPKTVETYRSRLMQKLNVNDIPNLVKFAIHHRLTTE